jgi:hypothetical protein
MRINFSGEDILQNRHYADLLDDGDFYAEYVEVDVDDVDLDAPIEGFTAVGKWRRYNEDGYTSVPGILTVLQADFGDNAPTYQDILEGNISAGRIFNCGWEDWAIETREAKIVYKFMSKETLHDGRCPKCGGIVEWGWWDPFAEEWDDPFRYGETPPQRSSVGRCPSCNIIFEFQI